MDYFKTKILQIKTSNFSAELVFEHNLQSEFCSGLKLMKFKFFVNKTTYEIDIREIKSRSIDSLLEDAGTRDFNINSLYYDFSNDVIYDDFTSNNVNEDCRSIQEMNSKIIHWNRDKKQNIFSDPTRYLRAIRFKSKLNFDLSQDLSNYLTNRSASAIEIYTKKMRIINEFTKMMSENSFEGSIKGLIKYGILEYFLLQIKQYYIRKYGSNPRIMDYRLDEMKIIKQMMLFIKIQKYMTNKYKNQLIKDNTLVELTLDLKNELRILMLLCSCQRNPSETDQKILKYIDTSHYFFVKSILIVFIY